MSLRIAVAVIGVFSIIGLASASSREASSVPAEKIPVACRTYAWIPADARDDVVGWNQLLSLAACLQDGSISSVNDSEQLELMVDQYSRALEVPTMVYAGAIEDGPPGVQLRAAYDLALAHLSLVIRARSSIVAPPDLATNPEAALRYRDLHAQLEPLLERSLGIAVVAFAVIDRVATRDPSIAADPVTRNMVRSARAMLDVLGRPEEPSGEHPQT
jgi:hypothetical protein